MPASRQLALLEMWRAADRRAQDLEQDVFKLAVQSMNGECPAPSEVQWEHARQAREHAKSLFQQAMQIASQLAPLHGPSADLAPSFSNSQADGTADGQSAADRRG
jgi:hypothetical protein